MPAPVPRAIAVVDAGYTNSKIALFRPDGQLVAECKTASRHIEAPPYRHIDPEPLVALCREALPELDRMLPVDAVIPCSHGAAIACLDGSGGLALPVMDYVAEPPPAVVEAYRRIAPPFSETYCTLLPMALTHGLQLYWQQQAFPQTFAQISTVIPWIQYVGYRLSGQAVTEISSLSCQSHIMDARRQTFSSLVERQGWARLFPPMAKAWERIGTLLPEFRGAGFKGHGAVLGGVHDSTANYMRYLSGGIGRFTLVSTGTWSIAFDSSAPASALDEARDANTNTDVLGRLVACSRFFGGREFEIVAEGQPADTASLDGVARLIRQMTFALPSFTDSGGPVPRSGGRGRITGPPPSAPGERASLAALYCALMVAEQLDAVGSRYDIVVDGPFAANPVLLGVLAGLRSGQQVLVSDLRDGTAAGAACVAMMTGGKLPALGLTLKPIVPAAVPGLAAYRAAWKEKAHAHLA